MRPAKQEVLDAIARLPDDADMDEIMHRLYVLDKVLKGRQDVAHKRVLTSEDMRREIEAWRDR